MVMIGANSEETFGVDTGGVSFFGAFGFLVLTESASSLATLYVHHPQQSYQVQFSDQAAPRSGYLIRFSKQRPQQMAVSL
jgi:hypothetical protein